MEVQPTPERRQQWGWHPGVWTSAGPQPRGEVQLCETGPVQQAPPECSSGETRFAFKLTFLGRTTGSAIAVPTGDKWTMRSKDQRGIKDWMQAIQDGVGLARNAFPSFEAHHYRTLE
eukprot:CAMPEP_0114562716 /NCGR_PEP_ID=MMETSP0114-20121206/12686_1 /TAXON_ID=31324 /ORGANISM="Goniomonas sp, Strain m" /LENGTH=116 /DNA_ID=CAMNT_0001748437 /DNA_START=254 /DNA_END=601 /DNA_ORIENTATION=-